MTVVFAVDDLPTVFLKEGARRFAGVEMQVGAIQNAAIGVIESVRTGARGAP